MVRVESAMLANAAQLDATGLVSVLGGFIDRIAGPQLPVRQMVTLVARITVDMDETAVPHSVSIIVEHIDGTEQVARIDSALPAGEPAVLANLDPDLPIAAPIVVPLPLEFRRLGLYAFRLVVDGEELWNHQARVVTTLPQL